MTAAPLMLILLLAKDAARYALAGRIEPEGQASVSVHAATAPFAVSLLADARGRFRVPALPPGDYNVVVFLPGLGSLHQTVAVGPGTADSRRRVAVVLRIEDARIQRDTRHGTVPARLLAVPPAAWRA